MSSFIIFLLSCLSGILEMAFQSYIVPRAVFFIVLLLETLLLSLPLPMMTVYLLHCCGENMRRSILLRAVLGIWAVSFALFVSVAFIDGFVYITPENQYYRGPLYPFLLIPIVTISLLNLAGTIKRRKRLSHKAFLAFLIAILPVAVVLSAQLFVDFYPLVDISYILSELAMYSFILSDQIEQDRRGQQEILRQQLENARQQTEIARQQREIANQRTSVMVLQMRPHFIYNTLMSIHSLCRLNPRKAEQITMDFTNYLRRNFGAVVNDSAIPFSTELEHTRAYLAVEQAQYDDMLVVDYDTAYTQFRLPPLTLQPIVENAVKHGMDLDADPLHISIRTRSMDSGESEPSAAEIIVEDTGPGFDPSNESKPHTTLENIRQRLEMMCGGSMDIKPREGGGTVVTVRIPDRTE
ncbi:MAG: histidine kinase [Lachnospiraceae bacterium]|nr:histidine kinase [Lachnospiraceae bacterium]